MFQPQNQQVQAQGLQHKSILDLFKIAAPYISQYFGDIVGNGSTPPAPPAQTPADTSTNPISPGEDAGSKAGSLVSEAPKEQHATEVQPQSTGSGAGNILGALKDGVQLGASIASGNPVGAVQAGADTVSTILNKQASPAGQVQGGETIKTGSGTGEEAGKYSQNTPSPEAVSSDPDNLSNTSSLPVGKRAYNPTPHQQAAIDWMHSPELQSWMQKDPKIGDKIAHLFNMLGSQYGMEDPNQVST